MASSDLGDDRGVGNWVAIDGRGEPPIPSEMLSLSELELELVRVRSEARAARFEARAAELELEARRRRTTAAEGTVPVELRSPTDSSPDRKSPAETPSVEPPAPAAGWAALAAAAEQRRMREVISRDRPSERPPDEAGAAGRETERTTHQRPAPSPEEEQGPPNADANQVRSAKPDSSKNSVGQSRAEPGSSKRLAGQGRAEGEEAASREPDRFATTCVANRETAAARKTDRRKAAGETGVEARGGKSSTPTRRGRKPSHGTQSGRRRSAVPPDTVVAAEGEPRPVAERRRRPAAWLTSVLMHLVVLLLLAALSLSVPEPQDQLAFSASAAPAASEPLESLTIESVDTSSDFSEQAPVEEAVRVDPLGKMAAAPSVTAPSTDPSAVSEPIALSDALSTAESLELAHAEMTTQFCGVAGGGNHFCYVVDSSQSMNGGRFESARAELLRSIDQLTAEQRFYIIFYDSNVDRMCVAQPGQPDEHSVSATAENKRAVRRWAMQVGLERGAPPDDALRFAFGLRPDVIFLLSDGEFPQRIEDLVAELNRDESLFGDQGPRTILHTIGYHSRAGEARMRSLAAANGGQYRYVPEP